LDKGSEKKSSESAFVSIKQSVNPDLEGKTPEGKTPKSKSSRKKSSSSISPVKKDSRQTFADLKAQEKAKKLEEDS